MRFSLVIAFLLFAALSLRAQEDEPFAPVPANERANATATIEQTGSASSGGDQNSGSDEQGSAAQTNQSSGSARDQNPKLNPEPKRILGLMPNFRAVSAGTKPPPPTPKRAFIIATQNSFDYSSLVFVGITSLMAEGTNTHPQLGKGIEGYGRYYWRGFADKTDGNYWVIFILPTIFHEDERYYALGRGGVWKRLLYSTSRVVITPNYDGHNTVNLSELLGRGISQGISLAYYPSQTRTLSGISSKYAFAIGRDALTAAFREFWPDISAHVLHRHP